MCIAYIPVVELKCNSHYYTSTQQQHESFEHSIRMLKTFMLTKRARVIFYMQIFIGICLIQLQEMTILKIILLPSENYDLESLLSNSVLV